MLKRLMILGIFIPLFLFSSQPIYAQTEHAESIETVLQSILSNQGVNILQELNCRKIRDEDFERVGEAVMEQRHPGDAHETMDTMMGGEGSESLKQMHQNMGSAYLGCNGRNDIGMMGGNMMSGGMMNNRVNAGSQTQYPFNGFGSMMGFSFGLNLVLLSLIVFLLSGAYFFIKQSQKK